MKRMMIYLAALSLFTGCATNKSDWASYLDDYKIPRGQTARFETINAIREFAQTMPAPLPEKTPFDDSSFGREQYLKGFETGWNAAVSGRSLQMTEAQIRRNPYIARGIADGQNEYSEPLKKFLNRMQKSMRTMHRR